MLDLVRDLRLLANARGIYEHELAVLVLDDGVSGVTRRTCYVGDDNTLLACYPVYQRGLAGIRLSYYCDLYMVITVLLLICVGEVLVYRVEHIARAVTVDRRYREGLAESEVVELIKLERRLAEIVHLVYRQYYRLAALYQHLRNGVVVRGDSAAYIRDKNYHVRLLYGEF